MTLNRATTFAIMLLVVATIAGCGAEAGTKSTSSAAKDEPGATRASESSDERSADEVLLPEGLYELTIVTRSSTDKALKVDGTIKDRVLAIECDDEECGRAYLRWWSTKDVARGYTAEIAESASKAVGRRAHDLGLTCLGSKRPAKLDQTLTWTRDGDDISGVVNAKSCGNVTIEDAKVGDSIDEDLPWLDDESAEPLVAAFDAYSTYVKTLKNGLDRCNKVQTGDCFEGVAAEWFVGAKELQRPLARPLGNDVSARCTAKWAAAKPAFNKMIVHLGNVTADFAVDDVESAMSGFNGPLEKARQTAHDSLVDVGLVCIRPSTQADASDNGFWLFDNYDRLAPNPADTPIPEIGT